MKVYALLEHYYNHYDEWGGSIYNITDDLGFAISWAEDFGDTETEWRTYREYEVI